MRPAMLEDTPVMALTEKRIRTAKLAEKPSRVFGARGVDLEVFPTDGKLWRFKSRFGGWETSLALERHSERD